MRKTLFLILALFFALTYLSVPTSSAQSDDSDYTVRLIYFLPRGSTPQPNIDTKLDVMLKDVQKFYADEMERHGFGRKTFRLETDSSGNAVVHHVNGKFKDADYHDRATFKISEELYDQFDPFKNIYFVAVEGSPEVFRFCGTGGIYSVYSGGSADGRGTINIGGKVNILAFGNCFDFYTAAHELGHAFGLSHNFHSDTYIMSYGSLRDELSPCHAEALDVHPYFNMTQFDTIYNTKVEMAPAVASPPHAVRLRFTVTDPDGLHQAQLIALFQNQKLLGCKSLEGQNDSVEFTTTELAADAESRIILKVIDANGNFAWGHFSIDVTDLLPRSKVSIPDVNLATVIREKLGLTPKDHITQQDMLRLISLEAWQHQITNLTGLEQAKNLKSLDLWGNQIRDITPLAGLTQLKDLDLSRNQISDITPLIGLPHLTSLFLRSNPTLDHAPIAALTQLRTLHLDRNQMRDVSFLAKLTQLQFLSLNSNQIYDITPLVGLTELVELDIRKNEISDIRPLIELRQLRFLKFADNPILDTRVQLQTLRQNNPDLRADADPKIEGPWLWMIVPTGQTADSRANGSWEDWLAAASEGSVTEEQIATEGATAGGRVKNRVWTLGRLTPTGGDNINEVVNAIGLGKGTIDDHVAYGFSIVLDSPQEQKIRMYAGSDDNHKVWLNGELVNEQLNWHWAHDYQESFPVTLKQGKNVLLVAIQNGGAPWGGYFGFEYGTVYSMINDTPQEVVTEAKPVIAGPKIEGPWLWMITSTEPRAGTRTAPSKDWLAAASDGAVTEAQIATEGATAGERLQNRVWTSGKLAPTGGDNVGEVVNTTGLGKGTIANHVAYGSIVLKSPREQKTWMYAGSDDNHKVWLNGELVRERLDWHWAHDYQESFPVTLKQGKNVLLVAIQNEGGPWGGYFGFENDVVYSIIGDTSQSTVDVNGDGSVNILDLVSVSTNFGKTGQNPADVNGDGIVNIIDLVKVASEMGADAAAPSAHPQTPEILTAADIPILAHSSTTYKPHRRNLSTGYSDTSTTFSSTNPKRDSAIT